MVKTGTGCTIEREYSAIAVENIDGPIGPIRPVETAPGGTIQSYNVAKRQTRILHLHELVSL